MNIDFTRPECQLNILQSSQELPEIPPQNWLQDLLEHIIYQINDSIELIRERIIFMESVSIENLPKEELILYQELFSVFDKEDNGTMPT